MRKKDYGTERQADGTIRRGTWDKDLKHGEFIMKAPNSAHHTIERWANGKLVSSKQT